MTPLIFFILKWCFHPPNAGSWTDSFERSTGLKKGQITNNTELIYIIEKDGRLVLAGKDKQKLFSHAKNNYICGTLMPRHEYKSHIELIKQRDKWIN